MVATVATSGLAYLQQLSIARLVSPAEFGIVRAVESALVVLLLLACFGTPTLAVRLAAEVDRPQQGALLRRLLLVAACSSFVVSIATVAWTFATPRSQFTSSLRFLVWTVTLTSLSRIIYNFHQGVMRVHRASVVATALAAVSFALLTGLVWRYRLDGWIAGRLVGEALSLTGLLWLVRRALTSSAQLPPQHAPMALLRFGAAITTSFFLRGALDATGIFTLGLVGADIAEIGYFGLGTLLATAILLLPASLGGVLLPRMVAGRTRNTSSPYLASGLRWAVALTVPISLLGTVSAPGLLALLLPAYVPAAAILQVLVWVAPLRAVTAVAGTQLLAGSNVRTSIVINGIGFIALAILGALIGPSYGGYGMAWATVLVELGITGATVSFAVRDFRRLDELAT
jgi:O-antigen/teichoic acid export membrane protein